jgi:hypothetical protein
MILLVYSLLRYFKIGISYFTIFDNIQVWSDVNSVKTKSSHFQFVRSLLTDESKTTDEAHLIIFQRHCLAYPNKDQLLFQVRCRIIHLLECPLRISACKTLFQWMVRRFRNHSVTPNMRIGDLTRRLADFGSGQDKTWVASLEWKIHQVGLGLVRLGLVWLG